MADPSYVALVLFLAAVVGRTALRVVADARARRVPPHVRVGQLRAALPALPHGAEVRIDPRSYRSLSVEMILHVAREQGFRLAADRRRSVRGAPPELVLTSVGGEARS